MKTEIIFKKQYLSSKEIHNINMYYETMNDDIYKSKGPYTCVFLKLGWQGCWDTSSRLEYKNNPIHILIEKLKKDFGEFIIWRNTIRHFCAPFDVHDDNPYFQGSPFKSNNRETISSQGKKNSSFER